MRHHPSDPAFVPRSTYLEVVPMAETHSSSQIIPGTDDHTVVPAETALDTLATPTTTGRRRPTQHEDRRDDYNEEEGY